MRARISMLIVAAFALMGGVVLHVPPGTVANTDIVIDTIVPADIAFPAMSAFTVCGEATTINNNTIYYGPDITLTTNTSGGHKCDIATELGSGVEGDEDEPIYRKAIHVLGMTCRNQKDANADITFTLHDDTAVTTPSVACTISDGERDCVADVQTTTIIAAASELGLAVSSTSDIGNGNGFACQVEVAF